MAENLTISKVAPGRIWGLIGLVIAADALIWAVMPGLGFVVLILMIALAAQSFWGGFVWQAWIVLGISLIPAIDIMQLLSFVFALIGLAAFCAIQVCGGWSDSRRLLIAALRLPVLGNLQTGQDFVAFLRDERDLRQSTVRYAQGLRDWIVPTLLGGVFVLLFAMANPIIDDFLGRLVPDGRPVLPEVGRVVFWAVAAIFVWPMLGLTVLAERLLGQFQPGRMRRFGVLTEGSVLRSLMTFNGIFAVQTLLDLAYLSGGIGLPDGITYAAYAHRGAYPLLVTALLAGGFALLTQPWLVGRPILKWLLLAWVVQNVVLVISSLLRLELYVDVYGLTRLRFAAFIWMLLVIAGLALMIWQILRGWTVGWLIRQSAMLAGIALFITSLINVDGYITRHNLSQPGLAVDAWYICQLSAGALPAIRQWEAQTDTRFCPSREPFLSTPRDWREWGYRNVRLRHKLNEIEGLSR